MSEVTDIQALVLGSQHQPVQFNLPDGRQFVAVPMANGAYSLTQITLENAAQVLAPKVVTQHVKTQTAGSLVDYIARFKNPDTMLFADIDNDAMTAIIDYHGEPTANVAAAAANAAAAGGPPLTTPIPSTSPVALSTDPTPRLGLHRATLKLPKSLEWDTWTKASGVLKSHTGFATFLEENSVDVVSPVGADLLELCRDLQVSQDVKFGSSVRMGDVTELHYQRASDATSKGTIALPPSIMLSIPVYFGEPKVSIQAFMRRQIEDGKLKLGIQLSRAEQVRQEEFHRIVDMVKASIGISFATVYGSPA